MSANLRNLVTAEDFHCEPVKARTVSLWANKMNKHIEDFMTEGSKSAQSQEKGLRKLKLLSVISGFGAKI